MTQWIAAIVKLLIDSFKSWWAAKKLTDLTKDLALKKEKANESLKTATDTYTDFMDEYNKFRSVTPNGAVPRPAADLHVITGQGGSGATKSASSTERDEPKSTSPRRRYSRTSRTVRRRKRR